MVYFLKTTSQCNNNCGYCSYLNKKSERIKTLPEIEKELEQAKGRGCSMVKLSCNTDTRKDFITILELIKKMDFKIILETNARIFYYLDFTKKISKYIYQYEIYFDLLDTKASKYMERRYAQNLAGIKNIKKYENINNIIIKVVLLGYNLLYPELVIDQIYSLGIKKIKLIIPFKLNEDDVVPALIGIVPLVTQIKKHAQEKKIKVINDGIEFNPYITQDKKFFDTSKAEVKFKRKKNKKPLQISVIIPTYNKVKYLSLVLQSFFSQTIDKSKYEIIVVDDGSTDNTEKVLKKINFDGNFSYIFWPRRRMAKKEFWQTWAKFHNRAGLVRNIGIEKARGNIILFNDNDIIVEPDCLKRHLRHHLKHPDLVVKSMRWFVNDAFSIEKRLSIKVNNLRKNAKSEKTEFGKKIHCRMYNLAREGWQRITSYNMSVSKKNLAQVGLFHMDSPFWGYEDIDLGFRLGKLKKRLMWDSDINVYHLPHPSQTGDELNALAVFWINLNVLYRKYMDEDMYKLYRDVILYKIDNIINKKLC